MEPAPGKFVAAEKMAAADADGGDDWTEATLTVKARVKYNAIQKLSEVGRGVLAHVPYMQDETPSSSLRPPPATCPDVRLVCYGASDTARHTTEAPRPAEALHRVKISGFCCELGGQEGHLLTWPRTHALFSVLRRRRAHSACSAVRS